MLFIKSDVINIIFLCICDTDAKYITVVQYRKMIVSCLKTLLLSKSFQEVREVELC